VRVVVNMRQCESNALCMGIAPQVFDLDVDDVLHVLDEFPDESLRATVMEAIRNCPKQAISLVEDPSA
jgi:ferredoxin